MGNCAATSASLDTQKAAKRSRGDQLSKTIWAAVTSGSSGMAVAVGVVAVGVAASDVVASAGGSVVAVGADSVGSGVGEGSRVAVGGIGVAVGGIGVGGIGVSLAMIVGKTVGWSSWATSARIAPGK